ncbi:MAG: UDP-N-acetylmuramate--alanine ligase [Candidatus Berkelbacteria bacterium Licking1014_96]|uniref:UDP-N-acetylmuramate--L-alanine ligase n=1 Tax=Candidatus Berkelbacteria bacterium Licking1014_96 TaxID=2017149 RepID=A0A554LH63_9BACT|nr:MAG: UDP-N-acetylmuramate--alanine ligase [Candidatus Berkelbacteria bacterium Licking1014_96]
MKLYLVGIGGISMSALAKFLHEQGASVYGSDLVENETVNSLRQAGIKVFIPQRKENIDKSIDEVVYTSAITSNSPGDVELQEARRLKIKTTKRAEKIGELTKIYKTIAVSGTHGKSTTTAMVLQILLEAGLDPSALLGSDFELIKGNYRVGQSKYLVIEADEFDRSFHNFQVDFGAILNLEADHLDYFKGGIEEIKEAFRKYIQENFKEHACLIYNQEDKNLGEVVAEVKRADLKKETLPKIKLKLSIPGEHNQQNARAAFALAKKIGVAEKTIRAALSNFKGASRRFEFKGEKNGVKVIDDYAHHPTEVKATLSAAREMFNSKRIIAVFQPHQYSRTKFFSQEFSQSFNEADVVIIPPIYEVVGRDEKKEINNYGLARMIKKNKEIFATNNFEETVGLLNKITRAGDVIIVMGAGPVTEISNKFLNEK